MLLLGQYIWILFTILCHSRSLTLQAYYWRRPFKRCSKVAQYLGSPTLLARPSVFSAVCSCRSAGFHHLRDIILEPERGKQLLHISRVLSHFSYRRLYLQSSLGRSSKNVSEPHLTKSTALKALKNHNSYNLRDIPPTGSTIP